MRQGRLIGLLGLLAVSIATPRVHAWEGGMSGVGGTIAPLSGHANIRMVAQRVVVDMTSEKAEVNCLFRLRNEGPPTVVRMGLPEWENDTQPDIPGGFTHFQTRVDGRRVPTHIERMKGTAPVNWGHWHLMSVRFAPHQTRLVQVHYGMRRLGSDMNGIRWFTYRMDTGVPWKGTIGGVDVRVRLRGVRTTEWLVESRPEGAVRRGKILRWHWTDLEPDVKGLSADILWVLEGIWGEPIPSIGVLLIPGYHQIMLNGRQIQGIWAARLEGQRTWTSLYEVARWLGGKHHYDDSRAHVESLTTAKHTIILRPGERTFSLDGRSVPLKTPCRLKNGNLFVPVNDLFIALGGKARFDKKTGKTYLTSPPTW